MVSDSECWFLVGVRYDDSPSAECFLRVIIGPSFSCQAFVLVRYRVAYVSTREFGDSPINSLSLYYEKMLNNTRMIRDKTNRLSILGKHRFNSKNIFMIRVL